MIGFMKGRTTTGTAYLCVPFFHYWEDVMQVNGEQTTLAEPVSVADYLEANGYRPELVAVELDGEIIPRDQRATHLLISQSTLEIVQFVKGG